jgi:hypothetical protein
MRKLLLGLALSTLIAAPALACTSTTKTSAPAPAITAELDAHLAKATLSDADLATVRDLRAKLEALAAENKFSEAFKVERDAMAILGYRLVVSRCAPHYWEKLDKKVS